MQDSIHNEGDIVNIELVGTIAKVWKMPDGKIRLSIFGDGPQYASVLTDKVVEKVMSESV